MNARSFDAIDLRMLKEIQANCRLTNVELADRVGLSPSPCLRRLKILESDGILRGYTAILDRPKVGLGLTVFVTFQIDARSGVSHDIVKQSICGLPGLVSCHLVSGEADYLLEIVVPDLASYEQLLLGSILTLPGARDIRTSFSIRQIMGNAPLPLDHLRA